MSTSKLANEKQKYLFRVVSCIFVVPDPDVKMRSTKRHEVTRKQNDMSDKNEAAPKDPERFSVASQGWIGLAVFMSFGLLFEGLIGYRSPAYLNDPMRRELLRLAHAHGTILSLLLLVADQYLRSRQIDLPAAAMLSLRIGAAVMPFGFLLGAIWHAETDPNFLIILSPIGGVMLIFGVVAIALTSLSHRK